MQSVNASYVILITHAPDQTEKALQALDSVRQLLVERGRIEQIFFYGPAVAYANCFLDYPSGLPNLQQQWLNIAAEQQIPLIVCSTVGSQYGLNALSPPEGNLQNGFSAGGLTEFVSTLAGVDHLLQL
ncbi:MAG: DsrE family protein [Aliidiomarina sp.]|uniref:DsrE/DsrF/TusD sulfur relay family protein n=1 Tax=Aliidiomarina sp. TaxID=1872439 RepID=UPI0025C4E392|nr:DsrE family protein [Aliidiomarina sp.]MCH8501837.1 DsrE family protein [Aliidiomarina sp.]